VNYPTPKIKPLRKKLTNPFAAEKETFIGGPGGLKLDMQTILLILVVILLAVQIRSITLMEVLINQRPQPQIQNNV